MSERWKSVVGYEGLYEVSDSGRVRRIGGGVLSPSRNRRYHSVILSKGNIPSGKYVHVLVADAFLGPCPAGLQRNHIDGNKSNNTPSNLEFVTPKRNAEHALELRLIPMGSRNWQAKLTEADIPAIRALKGKVSTRRAAAPFGISHAVVSRIWAGKVWRHVP